MIIELAQIALFGPPAIFLLYFLLGSGQFEPTLKDDRKRMFSILTDFPYEMMPKNRKNYALIFLAGYFFLSLLTNVSMFINFYDYAPTITGLLIISAFLTLSYAFFNLRIHKLTASLEKSHLGRFFVMGLTLILLTSINGIIFINVSRGVKFETLVFVLSIIMFVIALAVAIILVNPRLKTWAKLEKVVDEDGASSLKRPKPFVLAFSEWIVIFLGVLSYILTALCNYLIIGY